MFSKVKKALFENRSAKQTLLKNMFWLAFGQVGSKFIKAAITIYAARVLGASGYGTLSYILSLAGFFTIFADIGVSSILTRETAKNPEEEDRYFSTVAVIKLVLLIFTAALIVFIAPYFSKIPEAKMMVPFVALLIFFDGLRDLSVAFFRGKEKMELDAIVTVSTNFFITLFGFISLYFWVSYKSLFIAYIVASFCGFLIAAYFLRGKWLKIKRNFSKQLVIPITKSAWPMAVGGMIGSFLFNVDVVMLGWWRPDYEIGFYSAAQRIVGLIYNIPGLLAAAIFPMFSRYIRIGDNDKISSLSSRTITILLMAAIPIIIGGILLRDQVVKLVYGPGYAASANVFSIMIISIIVIFPFSILNDLVFAYDKQKKMLKYSFIAALTNIALNFLLIPYYGIIGATIATTLANVFNVGMLWRFVKKINNFFVLPYLYKIVISTLIMGVAVIIFKNIGVSLIINVIFSAGTYFALLFILRDTVFLEALLIISSSYKKITGGNENN